MIWIGLFLGMLLGIVMTLSVLVLILKHIEEVHLTWLGIGDEN